MKVTTKLFVVALILSLILTVSAVAAAEDITFDQSDVQAVSDETNIELSEEDETVLAENEDEKDSNSPLGGGAKHNC